MSDASAWVALLLTLKVAGCATALNLLLGVGAGFLLARKKFHGREFLDAILTLPMVMPPTVSRGERSGNAIPHLSRNLIPVNDGRCIWAC